MADCTIMVPEDELSYLGYLFSAIVNPTPDLQSATWATTTLFSVEDMQVGQGRV